MGNNIFDVWNGRNGNGGVFNLGYTGPKDISYLNNDYTSMSGYGTDNSGAAPYNIAAPSPAASVATPSSPPAGVADLYAGSRVATSMNTGGYGNPGGQGWSPQDVMAHQLNQQMYGQKGYLGQTMPMGPQGFIQAGQNGHLPPEMQMLYKTQIQGLPEAEQLAKVQELTGLTEAGFMDKMGGLQGIGAIGQLGTNVMDIYNSFKQMQMQKEMFNAQKGLMNRNLENQTKAYNNALQDKYAGRGGWAREGWNAQDEFDKKKMNYKPV
jgi:hypothetical protein